jgi:uncharacterized caspase-like protein
LPQSEEPVFVPAPALPPGGRNALIIAVSRYDDAGLRQLRSPVRDAEDFAAVLADPEIGGFAVTNLIDKTEPEIRRAIAAFLDGRGTDETILIYLSCHGIQDRRGRLYFAATDTVSKYPHASAIRAAELLDELDECRARRQVVILDCCFSGSFADHKGGPNIEQQLAGHSRGREVLTASRGFEYSLEGKPVGGEITGSVFTTGLVNALRGGEADADRDGHISVEDAYKYAFRHVQETAADQTPQHWLFGGEGERIILARSSAGRAVTPATLPEDLAHNLESRYPDVRIGAVNALAEWLTDPDPARAFAARRELRNVAETDSPRVAAVAKDHLKAVAPIDQQDQSELEPPVSTPESKQPVATSKLEPSAVTPESARESGYALFTDYWSCVRCGSVNQDANMFCLRCGSPRPGGLGVSQESDQRNDTGNREPLPLSSQRSLDSFRANLTAARRARGMSLAELARVSKVSTDDLIAIEMRAKKARRATVVRLADALDLEGEDKAAFMASAGV